MILPNRDANLKLFLFIKNLFRRNVYQRRMLLLMTSIDHAIYLSAQSDNCIAAAKKFCALCFHTKSGNTTHKVR